MANEELYVGQKITAVMEDVETNTVIATWEYEVLDVKDKLDASQGLETRLLSENWISPEAKSIHALEGTIAGEALEGKADTALEVTKFAWDFIKDNKAVSNAKDTTTSVILKGTDPLDYENATEGKTKDIRFYVHDSIIKDWILVDVTSRLQGTYHATPSKPEMAFGHYLPAVHFNVVKIFVGFSFRLDAHAEVTAASNLGPKDNVQPQVSIYAKFKVSWLSSNTHTASFVANGLNGFRFKGWN